MDTTKEFIQVRSANLKLRREFQDIGFLIPLEIEHAILKSLGSSKLEIKNLLESEGYALEEIERSINSSISRGIITIDDDLRIVMNPDRVSFARRLLLVDIIATVGELLDPDVQGTLMIPGYGACFGLSINKLSEAVDDVAPRLEYPRNAFANDISWLVEEKLILLR